MNSLFAYYDNQSSRTGFNQNVYHYKNEVFYKKMNFYHILFFIVIINSYINIIRILWTSMSANYQELYRNKQIKDFAKSPEKRRQIKGQDVSFILPAYNEELTVIKAIESIISNTIKPRNIFVVDDGSKDKTADLVQSFIKNYNQENENNEHHINILYIHQENSGKAAALNNAIFNHVDTKYFCCLDADSYINHDFIYNGLLAFHANKRLDGFGSRNIIIYDKKARKSFVSAVISMLQLIEYTVASRMKRGFDLSRMEYIVGGIGSWYKTDVVKEIHGYNDSSITEDMDLSMRVIVANKNKAHNVGFIPECVAHTLPAYSFKDLVNQRYRWKFGRFICFIKYYQLFFSYKKYSKALTWWQIPLSLYQEIYNLFEPLITTVILFYIIISRDFAGLALGAILLITFMGSAIIGESSQKYNKYLLMLLFIFTFPLTSIISLVEYIAMLRSIKDAKLIKSYLNGNIKGSWTPPQRT